MTPECLSCLQPPGTFPWLTTSVYPPKWPLGLFSWGTPTNVHAHRADGEGGWGWEGEEPHSVAGRACGHCPGSLRPTLTLRPTATRSKRAFWKGRPSDFSALSSSWNKEDISPFADSEGAPPPHRRQMGLPRSSTG